jgi:TRAP-type C4-dicarboxylate transport system permease large subunit
MILPISITEKRFSIPPMLKTNCPRTQKEAVSTKTILAPNLSIKIPPSKGMIIFGKA